MIRLGMLTPSSNTVLEPVTSRMVDTMAGVTAHFSRFTVREITLGDRGLAQFDPEPMLAAADLLAHAKVDVISWNGTSASWLGLESDHNLVSGIEHRTGIRASTCVLSLMDALAALGVRRYGLVTPYTSDVQEQIIRNFESHGLTCANERHFGISDNFAFGTIEPHKVNDAVRSVARDGAEAIIVLCTNLAGAGIAAEAERDTAIPVIDSVAVTVWGALRAANHPTSGLAPWAPSLADL